jgi:hypothetical protein
MPDFMSGIHDLKKHIDFNEVVDARHKGGHDACGFGYASVEKQNTLEQFQRKWAPLSR